MEQELKIELSEDLAYWVGVAQSDGYLTRYFAKREVRVDLGLGVCSKSLPMLERFRDISFKIFDRHSYIWKTDGKDEWRFHVGVKQLLPVFKKLSIILSPLFIPPLWSITEPKYFGAYLAGLIDGDGDIRIKRPKYPQCRIRLSSGMAQDIFQKQAEIILQLKLSQYRRHHTKFIKSFQRVVEGSWVEIEFGLTKKSQPFIEHFVIPRIILPYKREKLIEFIKRDAPIGI